MEHVWLVLMQLILIFYVSKICYGFLKSWFKNSFHKQILTQPLHCDTMYMPKPSPNFIAISSNALPMLSIGYQYRYQVLYNLITIPSKGCDDVTHGTLGQKAVTIHIHCFNAWVEWCTCTTMIQVKCITNEYHPSVWSWEIHSKDEDLLCAWLINRPIMAFQSSQHIQWFGTILHTQLREMHHSQ